MPLQYIIDGYNIINHTLFTPHINKKIKDQRSALINLILMKRLTGSPKNKVTVVFDGYPDAQGTIKEDVQIEAIFSCQISADEKIKRLVEKGDPKNTVVVSDDKEIKFFARAAGSKVISVEEFIGCKERQRQARRQKELIKPELSYTQIHQINEELKKLWLK